MCKTELLHHFEGNLYCFQLGVGATSLCLFAKFIYETLRCHSVIAAPAPEIIFVTLLLVAGWFMGACVPSKDLHIGIHDEGRKDFLKKNS